MSASTVEIADVVFCASHLKEVCEECMCDLREENDSFYGFDPIDRDPMETQAKANNDGVYQCEKHGSATCNQCFGWKKQITRLRAAAKKAGRR